MRTAVAIVVLALLGLAAAVSVADQFADFKARYGKQYADAKEEATRFAIFQENMKIAAKHQAANPHATFGVNEYADVSAAEFKVRHNAEKYYEELAAARTAPVPNLYTEEEVKARTVEKIDWRAKGAVTYIRNQGQCGSCWSFGTVAGIEGQWFLAGHKLVALSEQEFVSCDTIDQGCSGGLPQYAMKWDIENRGGKLVTAASYPYVSGNGEVPACNMKGTVVAAKITGYHDLPHNEKQMAAWCSTNGPITIGVDASSFQTYTGGILTNCISQQVDHCIAIVGFDLSYSTPYWIIKNSWGKSWGEEGYIRVEYGTDQCMITSGPITSEVTKGGPTPPPGPPTPVPPPPPPTPAPAEPLFKVNGAGSGFNPPKGYELATIADLQTDDFTKQVNSGNLMDGGETVAGCCCLAIAEGFLVYKDSPNTYLGAYDNTGSYDCQEVLTNPVYIGSSVNGGLPFPDWLNPLGKNITSKFTSAKNFEPLYQSGCTAGQPTWGIYKKKGGPTPAPGGPTPAPGKSFSQKVCKDDKCSKDCKTFTYALDKCVRTAEGYSMKASCEADGIKVTSFLGSEDCSGKSYTFTEPTGECLIGPSGEFIENTCSPGQQSAAVGRFVSSKLSHDRRKAL